MQDTLSIVAIGGPLDGASVRIPINSKPGKFLVDFKRTRCQIGDFKFTWNAPSEEAGEVVVYVFDGTYLKWSDA